MKMSALTNLIPPSLKGALRYVRGFHSDFYPFGFSMNGQTARLEVVRQIFYRCGIQSIIETGTFRGTTTEWLAAFGVRVITIESHRSTFEFAKRRLKRFKNVEVLFGRSADLLADCLRSIVPNVPVLAYLDAHWEGDLPLADEIDAICNTLSRFVVIIDDFEVPDDSGYSFDNYGPGKSLTAAYLDSSAGRNLARFYPAVRAEEETGNRRGWIVLTGDPSFQNSLSQISLLRAH
jgi:hypothetical protein